MASFSDDFNRANNTDLGANWVEVSGDWSVVSNQLSPGAAGGTIILRAAGAMATNDHYAQVTIAATTTASQGVWCRGNSNISQGYLWRNNGTSWDLFSVIGGSFTVIGTYSAAAVAGDVAKIQAVGTTIKGFINGTQRVSVTDTGVTTGTSVGIRGESTSALRYDDFAAADITAGATLSIASSVETTQPLTGTKTAALGVATETNSAQVLAGAKAATLSTASSIEATQPLTGALTATLSPAASIEAAQPLAGAKTATLGTALETTDAQTLTGVKTAPLPVAVQTETAQPIEFDTSRSLAAAASVEAAQPLTGVKSATLGPAMEVCAARQLVPAGPDEDIDVTVGAPYSPWSTGPTELGDWKAGAPW